MPSFNRTRGQKRKVAASPLSPELLHRVLSWFISVDRKLIDGTTLRSAALVNSTWKNVVDSKTLWEYSKEKKDGKHAMLSSMHRSLQIREVGEEDEKSSAVEDSGGSGIDVNPQTQTLMGFVNERKMEDGPEDLTFLVRERATGKRWILALAKVGEKRADMIYGLCIGHWKLGERFLSTAPCDDKEEKDKHHVYPSGIGIWRGRVARWYQPGTSFGPREPLHPTWSVEHELFQPVLFGSGKLLPPKRGLDRLFQLERQQWLHVSSPRCFPPDDWAAAIDWIAEMVQCLDLKDDTLFVFAAILDKYLCSCTSRPQPKHFQLIVGSCMLIANKCSQDVMSCSDIVLCADKSLSAANLTATEEIILQDLGWKLAFPTTRDFVFAYFDELSIDPSDRGMSMTCFILELVLQTDVGLKYPPSLIAASSIVLGRHCLREENSPDLLWPKTLEEVTGLSFLVVAECAVAITSAVNEIWLRFPQYAIIRRRYSKPWNHNVSEIPIPVLSSTAALDAYRRRLYAQNGPSVSQL